jgi:dihydrofolate reductase
MRNVIFAINITLDGCCDHTKMIADEEIHEYFTHLMRDVDLLVFGRKTYQLMVPFWPDGKMQMRHSGKSCGALGNTFGAGSGGCSAVCGM